MRLKSLAALAVAGGMLLAGSAGVAAQDYPNRPVKIVIAFSPSGAIDVLGRFIAEHLSEMWGQQVIVENRPGGSGNIGAAAAAHGAARRLHAAFRRADARRQRHAVADHGVRSGHELRADHAGRAPRRRCSRWRSRRRSSRSRR